ncbi:aldolase/citrate lyase family protein [Streptomyces sp. NPDC088789]|uniref:HpcH/HpaI aldolase/citrate lyase family protein n=1 Tax=Streptomyces sp. NPDC088789 TaxID=3365899 RepID=UPI00382C013D
MYVPGDRPERVTKALGSGADVVVIDLEDAVAPDRKEYARAATAERLADPQPVPVHVRVNALDGPWAALDLKTLATLTGLSALRLPKITSPAEIVEVAEATTTSVTGPVTDAVTGSMSGPVTGSLADSVSDSATGSMTTGSVPGSATPSPAAGSLSGSVTAAGSPGGHPAPLTPTAAAGSRTPPLYALLESALGIEHAYAIATAHPALRGISLGEADLRADLGVSDDRGLDWPRSRVVLAARAARLPPPPQSVHPDTRDLAGLAATCAHGRALGFLGRAALHPRQLPVIERAYLPTEEEIERARTVVDASGRTRGAQSLPDGTFVDEAVLRSARRTLSLADRG